MKKQIMYIYIDKGSYVIPTINLNFLKEMMKNNNGRWKITCELEKYGEEDWMINYNLSLNYNSGYNDGVEDVIKEIISMYIYDNDLAYVTRVLEREFPEQYKTVENITEGK